MADAVLGDFDARRISELQKAGGDPVTEADFALDRELKQVLLADGEGWLSEETADDPHRLECELVWIVDPLDGTREFIDGLPEFAVSVAAVIAGIPVVGGITNPAARVKVVGGSGFGLELNGRSASPEDRPPLRDTRVLASRSEVNRGQWRVVEAAGIAIEPMGSVAYKMARVAAGLDHATWTPVPKHEWDVAGGAALLRAAGGTTVGLDGRELEYNKEKPWLSGAIAVPPGFESQLDLVSELVRQQTTHIE